MIVEDIIKGFGKQSEEHPEYAEYANTLFQEAIQIGMEINNRYHTPEKLRELMGRLTGKKLMIHSACFRRFILTSGKIYRLGKMYLSIPAATFRIREALPSEKAP